MDVYDAGVFVSRFEAEVPGTMRTVLWGPLHARELGMPDWEVQDGGETGFIYHKRARAGRAGTMLATLIVSNKARRATVTVQLSGFPTTVSEGERNLEVLSLVTEAEVFCTRLAREPIRFHRTVSLTLVDQNHPQNEILDRRDCAPPTLGERHDGERRLGRRLGPGAVPVRARADVWDV